MKYSRELLEQFRQLYTEKFGEEIGFETAEMELANLTQLVKIIMR